MFSLKHVIVIYPSRSSAECKSQCSASCQVIGHQFSVPSAILSSVIIQLPGTDQLNILVTFTAALKRIIIIFHSIILLSWLRDAYIHMPLANVSGMKERIP